MSSIRVKLSRHLVFILLGAFLFSVPIFASLPQLDVDPTTTIRISAYTGGWGESTNKPSQYNWNNQLKCRMNQDVQYFVQIKASDLISPGNPNLPVSTIKYLLPYIGYWDNDLSQDGISSAIKYVSDYTDFTSSYVNIALVPSSEAPSPTGAEFRYEVQPQFQYAVKVPVDQPPGIYTGTIDYRIIETDAFPSEIEQTINIIVTVKNMFMMSIDRGTIDFENMLAGQEKDNTPPEGIIVTTKTNLDTPWFLKISNNSPLSNGPYVIPNSNFKWYGWTDGAGRWYGTGDDPLSMTPKLMYSSGPGEKFNIEGVKNHLKFKLKIPQKTKPGKYLSTVKLTLTE